MAKTIKELSGAPLPAPIVLATTVDPDEQPNIITLAWAGVACSGPLMLTIAIRPNRYSHSSLDVTPEVVINVPVHPLLEKVDYCGGVSGRDVNKFEESGLTAVDADLVKPPLIDECPINHECRVVKSLSLGTHDLFICEVVRTHVDEEALDASGRLNFSAMPMFVYGGLDYLATGEKLAHYGFTKKKD